MSDPYQGSAAKPLSLPAAVQKELKTAFNIDIAMVNWDLWMAQIRAAENYFVFIDELTFTF